MNLPEAFLTRMEQLLGDAYDAFLGSFASPAGRGLRVNPMKITDEAFRAAFPFVLDEVPWIAHGYAYGSAQEPAAHAEKNDGSVRPSQHPWYHAGLYYLQEPSAMTPADRLPIEAGDRVLDLCAAPGGKATQIAAKLDGSGLLVANEVSETRARALLRNLEQFGVRNAVVTNEPAERLAAVLPETFDKIILDAPCSGEGMFRRRPDVAADWSEEKVRRLASLQRQLVDEAVKMLRPGGLLMYSTCTFSPQEDEETILHALLAHPELEIEPIRPYEGFAPGRPDWIAQETIDVCTRECGSERVGNALEQIKQCVRIWPHKMAGEGHFLALLRKNGASGSGRENAADIPIDVEVSATRREARGKKRRGEHRKAGLRHAVRESRQQQKERNEQLEAFLTEADLQLPVGRCEWRGTKAYLMPELPEGLYGLKFLRSGLYLGESRPGRFVPSEPLALAVSSEHCGARLELAPHDPRVQRYLCGESIPVEAEAGWKLVTAGGHPIGWGKVTGQILKNHLPAGWRKSNG